MKKIILCFLLYFIVFSLSADVYGQSCGIGKNIPKESEQLEEIGEIFRLTITGLDEILNLIRFINENIPREQAIQVINLFLSMLGDVTINEGEICMPTSTLIETFREFVLIMTNNEEIDNNPNAIDYVNSQ